MNEPLLHPDTELASMRKRADYYEWLTLPHETICS